ncbi:hypothetical protein ACTXLV_16630 [Brachybacterium alimentarium]|uniref:hypothetical protein n=1 Tax=Brachybacterium alimentarium TaxID=47845 RepID=UPI003FD04A07
MSDPSTKERNMRSVLSPDLSTFAGRPLAVPLPDGWASTGTVMDRLGLTQSLATQLMVSELAGDLAVRESAAETSEETWVIRAGSKLLMPHHGLDLLADVPLAGEAPGPYINVRLGPGTLTDKPDDPRQYVGFHRAFTEPERYDAATEWWYFTRIEDWIGSPFVASLAGFVTLTGRIAGATRHPTRELVSFDVDTADEHACRTFSGTRIPVHPGGPALKVQPHSV